MPADSRHPSNEPGSMPPVPPGYLLEERLDDAAASAIEARLNEALDEQRGSFDPLRFVIGVAAVLLLAIVVLAVLRPWSGPRRSGSTAVVSPSPPAVEVAPPATPPSSTATRPVSPEKAPTGAPPVIAEGPRTIESPAAPEPRSTPPDSLPAPARPAIGVAPPVPVAPVPSGTSATAPEVVRESLLRIERTDGSDKRPMLLAIKYRRAASATRRQETP